MKRVVASDERPISYDFRVYLKDGNRMLFGGPNIVDVVNFVVEERGVKPEDIYKVEEVD